MPGDSTNINNKATAQNTYDAIVVGSGISGGWAAKELCEKGLNTLVLERGRNVEHVKWLKPDGSQITDTKGRVHVEEKDGRLLLMFDKINSQDHGKWSCVADDDESVLKFFHMKVYGNQFFNYIAINLTS